MPNNVGACQGSAMGAQLFIIYAERATKYYNARLTNESVNLSIILIRHTDA